MISIFNFSLLHASFVFYIGVISVTFMPLTYVYIALNLKQKRTRTRIGLFIYYKSENFMFSIPNNVRCILFYEAKQTCDVQTVFG